MVANFPPFLWPIPCQEHVSKHVREEWDLGSRQVTASFLSPLSPDPNHSGWGLLRRVNVHIPGTEDLFVLFHSSPKVWLTVRAYLGGSFQHTETKKQTTPFLRISLKSIWDVCPYPNEVLRKLVKLQCSLSKQEIIPKVLLWILPLT